MERTKRQSLHQEIRRKSPSQETEIENAAEPTILRSMKVEIVPDSKDSGIAQRGLDRYQSTNHFIVKQRHTLSM